MPFSPAEAERILIEGNQLFAGRRTIHQHFTEAAWTKSPVKDAAVVAAILGCADARTPVTPIFNLGVGDLFVVRNAGNICDETTIGSFELGWKKFQFPLLVVMGHTDCGAVRMAVAQEPVEGAMRYILNQIQPAVLQVKLKQPGLTGEKRLLEVIKENAILSVQTLASQSRLLGDAASSGNLKIRPAIYYLDRGLVDWLG